MKKAIRVHILPLYRCDINYSYCLYHSIKNDKNTLDLVALDNKLSEISTKYDIVQINIAGGEISLLSDFYFEMLYNLCKIYCKKIQVFTSFFKVNKSLINSCEVINVLYNFLNPNKTVVSNIQAAVASDKIINLKAFDIYCNDDAIQMINHINSMKVKSFEIMPYIKSTEDYTFCENKIKEFLKNSNRMKFAFQNKLQLDKILQIDNYNVKNIFVLPNGKYGLQTFENNSFLFKEYDEIEEFSKNIEELEIFRDKICKNCTSKLQCMANYFLNLSYVGKSCCGFKDLVEDYKKGRQQ